MVSVKGLTKYYGKRLAIDSLDFCIEKGEIVGFLGPNGAGKSTTMNIITGYMPCSGGSVEICGYDIMKDPKKAKGKIGYLPEIPPLYPDMTVKEYLRFVSELKGVNKHKREEKIKDIAELMNLDDVYGRLIKNLSKGYQQRVGFAQAIISKDEDGPEVLILDEPTIGLDPKQIIEIRSLIGQLGKRRTVILSSHILSEISAVCDKVIIINKGKIVATGTPKQLSSLMVNSPQIYAVIEGNSDLIVKKVKELQGVKFIEVGELKTDTAYTYKIEAKEDGDVKKALFFAMAEIGCPIIECKTVEHSLEDVFLEMTSHQCQKDSAELNDQVSLENVTDQQDSLEAHKQKEEE